MLPGTAEEFFVVCLRLLRVLRGCCIEGKLVSYLLLRIFEKLASSKLVSTPIVAFVVSDCMALPAFVRAAADEFQRSSTRESMLMLLYCAREFTMHVRSRYTVHRLLLYSCLLCRLF